MSTASQLRERVRIEQPLLVDDSYGGKTQTWIEVATVFAHVEPIYIGQTEQLVADQRSATAGYRVRVRVRADIEASMRLVWKTHALAIHSIHEQGELLSILTHEENL